jgi:GNAT superfamily N-acetyltransferase
VSAQDEVGTASLDATDRLAHRLIAACRPIRLAAADGDDELEAVFKLRYEVVVSQGWRNPDELPGGLERDAYDDRAVQVAAWDESRIAGTVRVIWPRAGVPIPVEAEYDVAVEPQGRVVGAGRLIVAPDYRGDGHRLLGGLAASVWLAMRQAGYRWAAGTATHDMIGLFERLGFDVAILSEPRSSWGELRYPIRMGPVDAHEWKGLASPDRPQL